jgi:hypothetical protein
LLQSYKGADKADNFRIVDEGEGDLWICGEGEGDLWIGGDGKLKQWSVSRGEVIKEYADITAGRIDSMV